MRCICNKTIYRCTKTNNLFRFTSVIANYENSPNQLHYAYESTNGKWFMRLVSGDELQYLVPANQIAQVLYGEK